MSVSLTQRLVLNGALHGGRRVRRSRRAVSLYAKIALIGAVVLAGAGIAMATPAGGFGTADTNAASAGDDLNQLAQCSGNCGQGAGPNGLGPPGNTGAGNQGNTMSFGSAGGFSLPPPPPPDGGGGGGFPPGGGGGLPPGGGGSGGFFGDSGSGGSADDPWVLIRGKRGAGNGGTAAQGALGFGAGQSACGFGRNGLGIASDGTVLFSQFFAQQTAVQANRQGCVEVVKYPEPEGTGQ